jgi:hypothetical protein
VADADVTADGVGGGVVAAEGVADGVVFSSVFEHANEQTPRRRRSREK